MKLNQSWSKRFFAGVIAVGGAFALSACAPETDPAATAPGTDTGTGTTTTEEPAATGQPDNTTATGQTQEDTLLMVAEDQGLNTFTELVEVAGLQSALQEGQYTVFAPTDDAFNDLPEGVVDSLRQPENREILTQILSYHVVPEVATSEQITAGSYETLEGNPLSVQIEEGGTLEGSDIRVNTATVTNEDLEASNGVIHEIDQVLLPADIEQQLSQLQQQGGEPQ